jgi:DNA-binding NarL/FixJ family response regulator
MAGSDGANSVCVNRRGVAVKSPLNALSARELEIMRYVAKGLTNQEIADSLGISERTVRTHVGNILSALQVGNRVAALVRLGWIRSESVTALETQAAFLDLVMELRSYASEIR